MSTQPGDQTVYPTPEGTVYPTPATLEGTVYPLRNLAPSESCPTCGQPRLRDSFIAPPSPDSGGANAVTHASGFNRFGPYELISEIAKGGMGIIYKARDTRVDHVIALKVILGADAEAFRNEVKTVMELDHPNILPIREFGKIDRHYYFTMPLMPDGSLQDLLKQKPLPPKETAMLVINIAEGVQYAHDRGVIHRDIKPQNILISTTAGAIENSSYSVRPDLSLTDFLLDRLIPRLGDFGLARTRESLLSETGQGIGTPSYMPPEQARGQRDRIGPRSDVYGLGGVLYAALTGRPPFQAATNMETMRQVCEEEPVAPRAVNPAVPRDLETICLKCLRKDPENRYPSAREFAEDLGRFLNGEAVHARPVHWVEHANRWCRRRWVWLAPPIAAAMAIVLVAPQVVTGTILAIAGISFVLVIRSRNNAVRATRVAEAVSRREREARTELEMTVTKLELAEKATEEAISSKNQFFASLSHEFRTPLNAIIGYAELLSEEFEEEGRTDNVQDINKILSAGKHLIALINDLLDLAKIASSQLQIAQTAFNLDHLIVEMQHDLRSLAEKNGNQLIFDTPSNLGIIYSDRRRVRQILFNLSSSSSRYTRGGLIKVRAWREWKATGEEIVFKIIDNGNGMTEEELRNLTELALEREAHEKTGGGTGLGFVLGHRLCASLGGTLLVESEPGKGTTYTVRLPVGVQE